MMRRAILGISTVVLVLSGLAVSGLQAPEVPQPDFSRYEAVRVLNVLDGDTIEVGQGVARIRVRLIGIDAPEMPDGHYASEATVFLRNMLIGESVYLVPGVGDKKDDYGRTLAYVYRAPDGLFANLEVVRQGYGEVYRVFPCRHREAFDHYEHRAKQHGKGLWEKKMAELLGPRETRTPALLTPALRPPSRPRQASPSVALYITKGGEKYHRAGCHFLRMSRIPVSLGVAKREGYTPCSVCKPPG